MHTGILGPGSRSFSKGDQGLGGAAPSSCRRKAQRGGAGALRERAGTPPSPRAWLLHFDIRSAVIKWDIFLIYWVKSFLPLLKNALLSPHRSWEFRKGINRQEFGSNRIFINTHGVWWGLKKNRIERADCQVSAQTYLETESEFLSNGLFICFARTAARRRALVGGTGRGARAQRPGGDATGRPGSRGDGLASSEEAAPTPAAQFASANQMANDSRPEPVRPEPLPLPGGTWEGGSRASSVLLSCRPCRLARPYASLRIV